MNRRSLTRALLLIALAAPSVGLSKQAAAQSTSIVGQVVDRIGQALPGVTITAYETTIGIAVFSESNSNGNYRFDALPDGTYRIDFELLGFNLFRRNNVRVRADAAATANGVLSISSMCECITVLRPAPLRECAGAVVDESGRPLPYARLTIGSGRAAVADRYGRFTVRLPLNERWSLTVADSGFSSVTRQVSGADSTPLTFTLRRSDTPGVPDGEPFDRGCRCPDDLFTHPGH